MAQWDSCSGKEGHNLQQFPISKVMWDSIGQSGTSMLQSGTCLWLTIGLRLWLSETALIIHNIVCKHNKNERHSKDIHSQEFKTSSYYQHCHHNTQLAVQNKNEDNFSHTLHAKMSIVRNTGSLLKLKCQFTIKIVTTTSCHKTHSTRHQSTQPTCMSRK